MYIVDISRLQDYLYMPPVDLYLNFEKLSWKNNVRWNRFLACKNQFRIWFLQATDAVKIQFEKWIFYSIWNLIFSACAACKNQFRNWFLKAENSVRRTWLFQLDFSKFKYRSTGGQFLPKDYTAMIIVSAWLRTKNLSQVSQLIL